MIYPRARLLGAALFLLLPFAAGARFVRGPMALCLIVLAVLICALAADAWLGVAVLGRVKVQAPAKFSFTKGTICEFTVEVIHSGNSELSLSVSPALPGGFVREPRTADLYARPGSRAQCVFSCIPRERGRFLVARCDLQAASPGGFWNVQAIRPLQTEIGVYPTLRGNSVAAMLLRRGPAGLHVHRMLGKGREFEKLRDYAAGDRFDEIHWKATARRGRPVVKVFRAERTQEVYAVIDASRLSARDGILEHFVEAALILGLAVEKQGDLFGLAAFSNQLDHVVRARSGKAHYGACREVLYRLEPRRVAPDFDELFAQLRLSLRRRALILFLTSLDDPIHAETFQRNVDVLTRRHLVVVATPRQPFVGPLFAGTLPDTIGGVYQRLSGHFLWNRTRELESALRRKGVHITELDPAAMSAGLVSIYLDIKQRQAL